MTRADLGQLVGVDASEIEKIERGEVSATLEQLRAFAGAFQQSMSALFDLGPDFGAAPEGLEHARVVAGVVRVFGNLAAETDVIVLPDVAVPAPSPSGLSWPDVVLVRGEPMAHGADWSIGNPAAIVEVLSDASDPQDRGSKFQRYRRLDSLIDYVIIDARKVYVEYYTRFDGDAWRLHIGEAGARLQLAVLPGLFAVDEIYRGLHEGAV